MDKTIAIIQEMWSCSLKLYAEMEFHASFISCWMSWASGEMPSIERWLREVWRARQLATADSAWLSGSGLGEGAYSRRCSNSNSIIFFMMRRLCMLVYKSQLKVRVCLRETSRDTCVHHNVMVFEAISL